MLGGRFFGKDVEDEFMGKLLDMLNAGRVLVSDGAWGTMMISKGMKPGECPELWNVEHADDIFDIAKSYIDAGADMVETNSFGGNVFKLEHYGLGDSVEELNSAAVTAARKAAGDKLVLGSIGPTGKMLLMGDVNENQLYEAFKQQAVALAEAGADAIVIETMTDATEAELAIRAAKENTDLDVICTFSFDKTKQGDYRTIMGIDPVFAMEAAINAGADITGTNCGNGIERMVDIVKHMKAAHPEAKVLVHANAGLPQNVNGTDVFPDTPELMANQLEALLAAGADIVGGCCGTTPAHIAAMRKVVDGFNAGK